MEKTKSEAQKLKEELFLSRKHGGLLLSEEELSAAQDYCEDYKAFLNRAKTERETVELTITMAEKAGFVPFEIG